MVKRVIAVHSEYHGLVFCSPTETWTVEEFITHLVYSHADYYSIREISEAAYPENSGYYDMLNILIEKDKDGTAYTEFILFWDDEYAKEWVEEWIICLGVMRITLRNLKELSRKLVRALRLSRLNSL